MIVKLLTEHHLEFLSLKGGCTGSPESALVKTPHCWKSHAVAQLIRASTQQPLLHMRTPRVQPELVVYINIYLQLAHHIYYIPVMWLFLKKNKRCPAVAG